MPAKPKNLLLSLSRDHARRVLRALGLSTDDWAAMSIWELTGGIFDRIVVLSPYRPLSEIEARHWVEAREQFRCRLSSADAGFYVL